MTILISRHVAHEGPGYFATFLERHGIAYRVVKIDENEALPPSIAGFSALVLMGGPMSVNDDLPWIPPALSLIREAIDAGKPVLGHCLGGQLISKALGGVVTANPVREIGWLPVRRAHNPQADAWLGDLPDEFDLFHWHGETFSIPLGATRILSSAACANQGFVLDGALALQCHVEMTADLVRTWARTGREDIATTSATVQNEAQMTADLAARVTRLHHAADVLYSHWIEGLA
jgi:GMP synthase-like glutamine amidotransferase